MAKFELSLYDNKTGEKTATLTRAFMPVNLYIKFQQFNEKLLSDKIKDDIEMFKSLKELFLELFPDLTAEKYMNNTDVAEIIYMFGKIINKSTEFETDNSKNV